MDINQQGGEYLRLIKDKTAVDVEIASILAGLRRFGLSLAANAKIIKDDPVRWSPDAESFCDDLREAIANAERHRELLGDKEDIRAALFRYENALVRA